MNKQKKTAQTTTNPRMYPMPLPAKGSPEILTRIDLRRVMELAGRNLLSCLDPMLNHLPIWNAAPGRDGSVEVGRRWFSHNLGRWWDALLRLESATGVPIPKDAEKAMLGNLKRFFDNQEHVCLQPLDVDLPGKDSAHILLDLHSLREGMLALTALTRHRKNDWARNEGKAMCSSLLRLTRDDCTWITEQFEKARIGKQGSGAPDAMNTGRLIEALVWHYEATGEPDALRAADRFARYFLATATSPDGSMGAKPGGHTHSYLGTLRGLLLFGELTAQRQYVDTIAATYEMTVRTLLKKSGFISHDLKHDDNTEPTSPGDAAQLALWLAIRHNHTEYLDDVERIVRARLVPCQITEPPPLQQPELAPLMLGGLGMRGKKSGTAHCEKAATTDITSAVLHTLVDVYTHIAVANETDLRVHFHFDYDDKNVSITSQREKTATVTITPKTKLNLWVRLPRWTPKESVRLVVAGKNMPLFIVGDYAFVPRDLMPAEVTLTYDLPVSTEIERTDGVDYSITWRGDEIIGISPNSDFLPFYPDAFVND